VAGCAAGYQFRFATVGGAVFLAADEQPVRGRTVPLLQELLSKFLAKAQLVALLKSVEPFR